MSERSEGYSDGYAADPLLTERDRLSAALDRVRALMDDWAAGRAPTAAIELRAAIGGADS